MVVRTKQSILAQNLQAASLDKTWGLTSDNFQRVSKLISEGRAVLKISVYPWGAEFDVIRGGPDEANVEGDLTDGV